MFSRKIKQNKEARSEIEALFLTGKTQNHSSKVLFVQSHEANKQLKIDKEENSK